MNSAGVYLDANATTPLSREVMAEMMPALADFFANPSSVHKPGQDARALVDTARERCARVLGCAPGEIVFTSGGTESDALAILGGRPARVVTTAVEHPAVLGACSQVAECVRVPVSRSGELDLSELRRSLPGASLCSVMAANNETGVIFPLREVAALCRDAGVPLHVDAVQAAGKMPLDFPWDLLSISAHKIEGPKGAGLLAIRRGVRVAAVQAGGHQEKGRRAGTENVAGIVGLGAALDRAELKRAEIPPADPAGPPRLAKRWRRSAAAGAASSTRATSESPAPPRRRGRAGGCRAVPPAALKARGPAPARARRAT